jgi:hypothetical protein
VLQLDSSSVEAIASLGAYQVPPKFFPPFTAHADAHFFFLLAPLALHLFGCFFSTACGNTSQTMRCCKWSDDPLSSTPTSLKSPCDTIAACCRPGSRLTAVYCFVFPATICAHRLLHLFALSRWCVCSAADADAVRGVME